jgi:hypothetical protein
MTVPGATGVSIAASSATVLRWSPELTVAPPEAGPRSPRWMTDRHDDVASCA